MKFYSSDTPCCITGEFNVDLHHVKTRAAGGTNDKWNLMPLSHRFHVEVHAMGLLTFAMKYPQARNWLKKNGWEFCEGSRKWRRKHG
jgi:hypothetical protein